MIFLLSIIFFLTFQNEAISCQYSLPYSSGTGHRTLQGYYGKYSHQSPLQYGVDFKMPLGTEIHAARSGLVLEIKKSSNESGKDLSFIKKSNFIKIIHSDKTIALYAHLKFKGVLVHEKQEIKEGEVIGLSGCTGYCHGPHLHFEVYRPSKNKQKRKSIPTIFWSSKGLIYNIKKQKTYKADKNPKPCP